MRKQIYQSVVKRFGTIYKKIGEKMRGLAEERVGISFNELQKVVSSVFKKGIKRESIYKSSLFLCIYELWIKESGKERVVVLKGSSSGNIYSEREFLTSYFEKNSEVEKGVFFFAHNEEEFYRVSYAAKVEKGNLFIVKRENFQFENSNMLKQQLSEMRKRVETLKEPAGFEIGEENRRYLKTVMEHFGKREGKPVTAAIIYATALCFNIDENLREELEICGKNVCSREKWEQLKQEIRELSRDYRFVNFEDTPFESNRAVTPEIIAMIYENMLESSEREKKGSFYTPHEIVMLMAVESIALYLSQKSDISAEKLNEYILFYEIKKERGIIEREIEGKKRVIAEAVKNIKCVDPACGAGAFITGMAFCLKNIMGRAGMKEQIGRGSMFAVDIDNGAIEALRIRTAVNGVIESEEKRFPEFVVGNSITQEKSADKKFQWQSEFKNVFDENDGFDIVIGNPPYVGEKGNREIFKEIMESDIGRRFYSGRSDLLYFFFHAALDILKDNGIFSFITTNYFITATAAEKLRADLKERAEICRMINFGEKKLFRAARGHHSLITTAKKGKNSEGICETLVYSGEKGIDENLLGSVVNFEKGWRKYDIKNINLYHGANFTINLEDCENNPFSLIFEKMKRKSATVGERFYVNQGIVSGADKVTRSHVEKYDIKCSAGEGIYVLDKEESRNKIGKSSLIYNFYKNSDISKYHTPSDSAIKLIYITKKESISDYPEIESHLLRYKMILENKRETKMGTLPWYSLHWPRKKEIFTGPKIVVPQRSIRNVFGYNETEWFASADVYYITSAKNNKEELKFLLALLNSRLYFLWLFYNGKRKGDILELYAKPLEEIPFPFVDEQLKQEIIENSSNIVELRKNGAICSLSVSLERKIDVLVYKIFNLSENEIELIENEYRYRNIAKNMI